ncbi:MAG TPA: flavin reductase family protein [Gemmatimonadales bacterium]|jgi:flavin reductase (DIM6/NTAB) family NADH-FMN oxidoreductase RutF|nr:flavin reductase family protein [Gemmatimonadales bacterium]
MTDQPTEAPLAVFRRLTNGVYVIGVSHQGRSNAFTAAWVTQVSFEPLMLALSINPAHASYPLLVASGAFVVNVLAHDGLALAAGFGTRSGREADKLAGVRWRLGASGPVLLDAAAHLECRVVDGIAAGDHRLVVARVTDGAVHHPGARPLRYDETGDLDGSSAIYPRSFERAG